MTRIYRVTSKESTVYVGNRPDADREAQARADADNEPATIEWCQLIDRSHTNLACAFLNGQDWCARHSIVRYVKPKQQQRAA
jgi:hypothetical protein